MKQIRSRKDIVILSTDKGSWTVVRDHMEYKEKLDRNLQDRTKFKNGSYNKDKTHNLEKNVYELLSTLCATNVSDPQIQIRARGKQIPRLYGLSKLHKSSVPIQPILSMLSLPQHKLANWLVKAPSGILSPQLERQFSFIELL